MGTTWVHVGCSLDPAWTQRGKPGFNLDPAWIQVGFNWIQIGSILDLAWAWAQLESDLDPAWIWAGSSLDPIWIQFGSSLDPSCIQPGYNSDPRWTQPGSSLCQSIPIWGASAPYSYMLLHQLYVLYCIFIYTHDMSLL